MPLLSATTQATKERLDHPNITFYVTPAHLQIPVTNVTSDPHFFASMAMSKLREKEPDIQLLSVDDTPVPDDTSIPKDKQSFNTLFKTKVKAGENENHTILIFLL